MKKVISIFMVCIILLSLPLVSYGENYREQRTYVDDGQIITYYVDNENIPYQIVDGQKMYIVLPLAEYEVKDEAVICELNSNLPNKQEVATYSAPANYYDLSTGEATANSIAYTANATLNGDFFTTSVFKFHRSHVAVVVKTSSHKPLLCSDKNINIMYYYYREATDSWYVYSFMDKSCSGTGFRFMHSPSIAPYGQLKILAHSTLTSCKLEVFTTPYASSGAVVPIE